MRGDMVGNVAISPVYRARRKPWIPPGGKTSSAFLLPDSRLIPGQPVERRDRPELRRHVLRFQDR
jgi:hypothetical protein